MSGLCTRCRHTSHAGTCLLSTPAPSGFGHMRCLCPGTDAADGGRVLWNADPTPEAIHEMKEQQDLFDALREQNDCLSRLSVLRDALMSTERRLALARSRIAFLHLRANEPPHRWDSAPSPGMAYEEREQ